MSSDPRPLRQKRSIMVPDHHYTMTADGDSMQLAGIFDGDTLYCKRRQPRHRDIVIAQVPGEGSVVKRYLKRLDAPGLLMPESNDPQYVGRAVDEDTYFRGVVVACSRGPLTGASRWSPFPEAALPDEPAIPLKMGPAPPYVIPSRVKDGAPVPPPMPEDVFPQLGRTLFSQRLRAIERHPAESEILLRDYAEWEQEWVVPARMVLASNGSSDVQGLMATEPHRLDVVEEEA